MYCSEISLKDLIHAKMRNTLFLGLLSIFLALGSCQQRGEPGEGDFNLVYFANETKVNEFLSLGKQFFALYFTPYPLIRASFLKRVELISIEKNICDQICN